MCDYQPYGLNPDLVAQLPSHAQLFYPFVLSKRSGFHMEIMDLMPSLCDEGVGPSGISKLIREFHTKELVFQIILANCF
jgi:hypothetical protein